MPAHRKLVCGRGVNDAPFPTSLKIKSYRVWNNMLARCYGARTKSNSCYVGCEVDPRWHSYMAFKEWFDANHREGWDLEKDLLVPGNKVYGPDTCVFVPHYVNQAVAHLDAKGYFEQKNGYNVVSGKTYIGFFKTEEEARRAWVTTRISNIIMATADYMCEPGCDERVVEAMRRVAGELVSPTPL